jgi:hypothetical protein
LHFQKTKALAETRGLFVLMIDQNGLIPRATAVRHNKIQRRKVQVTVYLRAERHLHCSCGESEQSGVETHIRAVVPNVVWDELAAIGIFRFELSDIRKRGNAVLSSMITPSRVWLTVTRSR